MRTQKFLIKKITLVTLSCLPLISCNQAGSQPEAPAAQDNTTIYQAESSQHSKQSALLSSGVQTITVSPIHDENKFDGWGTSLAWWGANHGDQEHNSQLASLFFSMNNNIIYDHYNSADNIKKSSSTLPGLGFNIIRYNLGGGEIDNKDVYYYSSIIDKNRWVNGFWTDPKQRDPSKWDWNNDQAQVDMLKLSYDTVKKSGARPIVEMFSNSPMWWMTATKSTQGAGVYNPISRADDCIDMHDTQMLDNFGYYIAKSAEYFQKLGIKIDYVEPFNEPNNGWWAEHKMFHFSDNTQEGCNMWELDSKQRIIKSVRDNLAKSSNIQIAAADYNQMNQFFREYPYLKGKVDKINVHSYDGAGPYEGHSRRQIHDMVVGLKGDDNHKDMKLWQSEFGTWSNQPDYFFRTIAADLAELRVNAWVIWQAVDPEWGLIAEKTVPTYEWDNHKPKKITAKTNINGLDFGKNIPLKPSPLYFVMAQFSRHIRPSDHIVTSSFSPREEISREYLNGGVIAYSENPTTNTATIKIVADTNDVNKNSTLYNYNLNEIITSLKLASSAKAITDIRVYDYEKSSQPQKASQNELDSIKANGVLSSSSSLVSGHHFYTLEIDVKKDAPITNNHISRIVLHDKTEFGWCMAPIGEIAVVALVLEVPASLVAMGNPVFTALMQIPVIAALIPASAAIAAANIPLHRCDEYRGDYPTNFSNWYAYIENNFYPSDWLPGKEKMTCPANAGYYVTGIAQGSVLQCSQNSEVFPNNTSTETEIVTTEIKRAMPNYDWAYGMSKIQCSNGKAIVGTSSDIHEIFCAKPSNYTLDTDNCETRWFDNRDTTTIDYAKYPHEDFARNLYKVNVADDEYIAGIAYWGAYHKLGAALVCSARPGKIMNKYQSTITSDNYVAQCPNTNNGVITGINNSGWINGLCRNDNNYTIDKSTITTVANEAGIGGHTSSDWAPNWHKRECPVGKIAIGFSRDGSQLKCASSVNNTVAQSKNCKVRWFNQHNDGYVNHQNIGDWAVNSFKGEVSDNNYVAGIASYSGSGKISAILECPLK